LQRIHCSMRRCYLRRSKEPLNKSHAERVVTKT
jgi:hypothetical protein